MCFSHNRLVITLLLLVAWVSYCYGCNSFLFASLAPRTCNLRCNRRPTLLDYDCPFGCYCHDTCGGSLPCCGDKNRYCGSSFVSGGQQSCIIPKRVRSAKIVGEEKTFYTIGESITYECNFHYVMDGSSTRTCIFRNVWSPGPPSCSYELHVCRPLDIKDGFVSETKKQFLNYESVRVWCKDGYVLQGSSRSTCVRSRWSPSTPRCLRIPCYNHRCTENEMCVDSGDGSGRYTCECKDEFITFEEKCIADPCLSNDCHENATCVVNSDTYECSCTDGYIGNGTTCNERLCNSTAIYGEEIEQPCAACEDICCDDERIRDCRICIHTQCNGGEVCGEDTSRVPTVCSAVQCFENKGSGGFTVDTPDNVVCFNDEGKPNEDMHCCWIGE